MDINELGISLTNNNKLDNKKEISFIDNSNLENKSNINDNLNKESIVEGLPSLNNSQSNENIPHLSHEGLPSLKDVLPIEDNKPKKRVKFDDNVKDNSNIKEIDIKENKIDKIPLNKQEKENVVLKFIKSNIQTVAFLILMIILYIIFYYIHNIREEHKPIISSPYNIQQNKKIDF